MGNLDIVDNEYAEHAIRLLDEALRALNDACGMYANGHPDRPYGAAHKALLHTILVACPDLNAARVMHERARSGEPVAHVIRSMRDERRRIDAERRIDGLVRTPETPFLVPEGTQVFSDLNGDADTVYYLVLPGESSDVSIRHAGSGHGSTYAYATFELVVVDRATGEYDFDGMERYDGGEDYALSSRLLEIMNG